MKTCTHCGGDLLRHAVMRNRNWSVRAIRYKCRDCQRTFSQPMERDEVRGTLHFNATGRPTLKDWRAAA